MRLSKLTIMPKFKSDVAKRRLWTTKVMVIGFAFFLSVPPVAAADREMTQEYLTCIEKSNGVTAEMINCILAETRRQDARLNENYKRLISKLATERKNALVSHRSPGGAARPIACRRSCRGGRASLTLSM